jgi:hypothetical protein
MNVVLGHFKDLAFVEQFIPCTEEQLSVNLLEGFVKSEYVLG